MCSSVQLWYCLVVVWAIWLWVPYPGIYRFLCAIVREPERCEQSVTAKNIANMKIVVDKMHFSNHIDKWWWRNCDPYKVMEFNEINKEASEQTFYYISRLKYSLKHMNKDRFNLYLFYVMNLYNESKLRRRYW